jgi:hypothetical protein
MHHLFSRFLSPAVRLAPMLALSLLFFGCGGHQYDDDDPAAPLGPEIKPMLLMTARDTFSDGRLTAEITLSRGRGHGGFRASEMPGLPRDKSSGDVDQDKITRTMVEEMQARRAESPLPPVVLQLRLTSAAKELLKVEIVEFKSSLGDFAVQPARLALDAGQSAEPDPMISRLGITSAEIPVTVVISINGRTERRVITLRPVPSGGAGIRP